MRTLLKIPGLAQFIAVGQLGNARNVAWSNSVSDGGIRAPSPVIMFVREDNDLQRARLFVYK